jgi:F-type H+-transporting ATPase subunit delta
LKAIADRYAAALLDVATERGFTADAKEMLDSFSVIINESADLRQFLANPAVPHKKKIGVMQTLLDRIGIKSQARPLMENFLGVVADHRRAVLLPQIAESFTEKMHERMGIAVAKVCSAAELNERERVELERAFARVTNMKIEAHYSVEPELVGGAVVRIGSVIYDGSVKEQLKRMEEKLAGE